MAPLKLPVIGLLGPEFGEFPRSIERGSIEAGDLDGRLRRPHARFHAQLSVAPLKRNGTVRDRHAAV